MKRGGVTLDEYQELALRTDDGNAISDEEMTVCCALGVSGEAGEVAEIVKKWRYHGRALDMAKLAEEMGDVLWYLAVLANRRGLSLEDIAQGNIAKLRKRYPHGYNHADAERRRDVDSPIAQGENEP